MFVYRLNIVRKEKMVKANGSLIKAIRLEKLNLAQEIISDDPASVLEVDPVTKETPLHVACYEGLDEFFDAIVESPHVNFSALDGKNFDVLQAAMSTGDEQFVGKVFNEIKARAPHLLNNPPAFDMNDNS